MSDYAITYTQTISTGRFEFWSGAKERRGGGSETKDSANGYPRITFGLNLINCEPLLEHFCMCNALRLRDRTH